MCMFHHFVITKVARRETIKNYRNDFYPFQEMLDIKIDEKNIEKICNKCGLAQHYKLCHTAWDGGYIYYKWRFGLVDEKDWTENGYIIDTLISYDDIMKKNDRINKNINYCPYCGAEIGECKCEVVV